MSISKASLAPIAGAVAWNWFYAYCVLSTRFTKRRLNLDHQSSPREDLVKYGEQAVKDGKITQQQLSQIKRKEAASANSVEGFTFFLGSVLFALHAGVPVPTINKACLAYTAARLAYGPLYIYIEDEKTSALRALAWWAGNISCFTLLWHGAKA